MKLEFEAQSTDIRCHYCGKLIAREAKGEGEIELKCSKCKQINKIKFK